MIFWSFVTFKNRLSVLLLMIPLHILELSFFKLFKKSIVWLLNKVTMQYSCFVFLQHLCKILNFFLLIVFLVEDCLCLTLVLWFFTSAFWSGKFNLDILQNFITNLVLSSTLFHPFLEKAHFPLDFHSFRWQGLISYWSVLTPKSFRSTIILTTNMAIFF